MLNIFFLPQKRRDAERRILRKSDSLRLCASARNLFSGRFSCILACFIIIGCLSCGRKALPTPAIAVAPPFITGVAANIEGDTLFLTWPVPEWKTENGDRLAGFYVYRSAEDMADPLCEDCPRLFQKAATQNIETKRAGESVLYTEPVKKGFRYFYRVSCYTEDDIEGEKSETVTILP